MDPWRMRPRFKEPLEVDAPTLMGALREGLRQSDCRFIGTVLKRHASLTVCEKERHFWSPHLSLDVVQEEDGARMLRARYGPHPSLWTGIAATYAVFTMLGLAGAMFGASQCMLGRTPWALWGVAVAGVLSLALWASARVGQKLAAAQMQALHVFLCESLRRASERSPFASADETCNAGESPTAATALPRLRRQPGSA